MNVLSLFDGMSCGHIALERAGIKVDKYYASEIDKYAMQVTQANYSNTIQLGDITNWNFWEEFNEFDFSKIDLLLAGFPCFAKGTTIITTSGYKNIEDITIGDEVLTHNKQYKKVINVGRKEAPVWRLKAQGCLETFTTENHPYYIREMSRKWDNSIRAYKRIWAEPKWKKVGTLHVNSDFVGLPIINIEENKYNLSSEICWLFGRYVADGYIQDSKRLNRKNSWLYKIIICVGKTKAVEFEKKILTLKYTKTEERTCYKYCFNSKSLLLLLKQLNLGRGALNKVISQPILHLPKNLAKDFLDGYMSGDGSFSKGKFKATTISKYLCMSLNLLIAKVYETNSTITYTKRPKISIIEGRTVNQHDTYTTDFFTEMKKQSNAVVLNGFIWLPIKEIQQLKETHTVYNFEVQDDNSYTANNVVVHNCQSWSLSGKQKGLKDPRGKLALVLSDIFTYAKKKNPNLLFLFENVRMKKENLDFLDNLFGVKHIMINSSLVSAQNRLRAYWTNIPNVTQPEDKGILLKDIVHENTYVDREKSYCIDANYYKGGNAEQYFDKSRRQQVFDNLSEYIVSFDLTLKIVEKEVNRGKVGYFRKDSQANRVYHIHDKAVTLCGDAGGGAGKMGQYLFGCITPDRIEQRQNGQRFNDGKKFYTLTAQDKHGVLVEGYIRKLTPTECERLQTVSDNYTNYVSNSQRYKMLGNGWTVDVITHILKKLSEVE